VELSSRRILVSEWVDGVRLVDCPPEFVCKIISIGVECFLAQLLEIGKFHSDPHPGNMLVRGEQLVLLDFGLVATVDRASRENITKSAVHLINCDFHALFDDLVALGFLEEDADREAILPTLSRVLEQGMRAGGDIRRRAKNFQSISDDLNVVFYEMPFKVPTYFALITRALALLEGIALVGDAEFDIFWAAYPYCLSKSTQLLGRRQTAQFITGATARLAQQLTAQERTDALGRPFVVA